MLGGSIPLPSNLNPPPSSPLSLRHFKHSLPLSFPLSPSLSKPLLCFSSSLPNTPPSSSPDDDNHFLWLREEQRWLREEQRWLREEQRWLRERDSLLNEIHSLKLQIKALEKQISVQEVDLVPVRALLQVLNEKNLIAESGSATSSDPSPIVSEVVKEVISVPDKGDEKKRTTLRKGSEGEDVRKMQECKYTLQEALLELGFYSGEEDMEFSSFSSGTDRAVKTWQATFGAPEDGIMTAQLLERLYVEQQSKENASTISIDQQETILSVSQNEVGNGAAVASVTEISETQQKIVKEEGVTEVKASKNRVFLLGENRWEEPSRLNGKDKQVSASNKNAMTKCLSCRGEGRLLCTECDGTGEPNIEPQFLEWVDEGAKCPYCEGLGYTICEVCEGKTVV